MKSWKGYFKTKVSKVAPPHKILVRGYPIEELIGNLSFAEGVFLTLTSRLPTPSEANVLDAMLICALDHQFMTANTAAARYIASGCGQVYPAVAGSILCGGEFTMSPQPAAELIRWAAEMMKRDKKSRSAVAQELAEEYAREKKTLPGCGHPFHKGYDPRAVRLRKVAEKFGLISDYTLVYEDFHARWRKITGKTSVAINLDGMLACIATEIGFTPIQTNILTIIGCLPGVTAHVIEEIEEGVPLRIIPDAISKYVGPPQRHLPKKKNQRF